MAKDKARATAGPATKGLKVIARPQTFRRAGYAFTREPVTIALSELTPEQVELLKAEPSLVVQEVDIEPVNEEAKA